MFARTQKFQGIQKLRLKRWQSQLYESVRKGQVEIYKDEPEAFGLASVSENPYKDLDDIDEIDFREYQVKVKTEKEQ